MTLCNVKGVCSYVKPTNQLLPSALLSMCASFSSLCLFWINPITLIRIVFIHNRQLLSVVGRGKSKGKSVSFRSYFCSVLGQPKPKKS